MYYRAEDVERVLTSCTFCWVKLDDEIRLIPDCQSRICGKCYQDLKENAFESKSYKCRACESAHILPSNGLPESKPFPLLLQIKPCEKPISSKAQQLKHLIKEIEDEMKRLESFNGKEIVELECEMLNQKISDVIESAIGHLKKIEENLMKQISEYRDRCLENLSAQSTNNANQELAVLTEEVAQSNARWNAYFKQIDVYETESDIQAALDQTTKYNQMMQSLGQKMKAEALNWQKMVFKVNSQFFEEWNQVGEVDIIAQPKPDMTGKDLTQTPNSSGASLSLSSTKLAPKIFRIQDHPSFILTKHSDIVRQVLFLPDGRLISCSDDTTIKIWNVHNGEELFELRGHASFVYSIAILPNGHLASGSADKTIKIWDLKQREEIRTINGHTDIVASLRVLKNGNLVSYSKDDTIKIWNLNSKDDEPVSVMKGHGNTFYWLLPLFGVLPNNCLVVCCRYDGDIEKDCVLRVWNPNESVMTFSTGFADALSLLVLSNDQVVVGFGSGNIKIIDLTDEAISKTKERAHESCVFWLAKLSNENLISAGRDGSNLKIKMWNFLDWSLLQTVNTDHLHWIISLSISADKKFLASGSNDKTIKVWPIISQ